MANIWFEEVNIGLLEELNRTVRIKNYYGELTPLENPTKSFVVRKPEEDFKLEVFPCVSIYAKTYDHDAQRYNPAQIVVDRDYVNNTMTLKDSAVPFNLDYQIDFWSRFQTDMDIMLRSWLTRHFHQFNLTVVDDMGNEVTCNCLKKGTVTKSDLVSGGERLFHSIINYQIWVELDDETRYNVPMASEIKIDTP